MVFSSIPFLFFFLPAAALVYFLFPSRLRNGVLLGINLVYYLCAAPAALPILVLLILCNYLCGLSIGRFRLRRKLALVPLLTGIVLDVLALVAFKYQLFPAVNAASLPAGMLIPIGISIYTLQGISYLMDVYYRRVTVQRRLVPFAMYLSMFPQMICGPVVRYSDVAETIARRNTGANVIARGYNTFIRGLAKKLFLADTMLALWNTVKDMDYATMPALTAWLGIVAFAFAMYFYFSGYTDMARGIAKIFGFNFPINFNAPYAAKSLTDFWRRWNISLNVWGKAYVLAPIGRRRSGFFLTVFQMILLWVLLGAWYGGSVNYLLWGLVFGVLIVMEQLFFSPVLERLPVLLRRIYTLLLVGCGWVLFAMPDLVQSMAFYRAMFTGNLSSRAAGTGWNALADDTTFYLLGSYALVLVLCVLSSGNLMHHIGLRCQRRIPRAALALQISGEVLLTVLCLLAAAAGWGAGTSFFVHF